MPNITLGKSFVKSGEGFIDLQEQQQLNNCSTSDMVNFANQIDFVNSDEIVDLSNMQLKRGFNSTMPENSDTLEIPAAKKKKLNKEQSPWTYKQTNYLLKTYLKYCGIKNKRDKWTMIIEEFNRYNCKFTPKEVKSRFNSLICKHKSKATNQRNGNENNSEHRPDIDEAECLRIAKGLTSSISKIKLFIEVNYKSHPEVGKSLPNQRTMWLVISNAFKNVGYFCSPKEIEFRFYSLMKQSKCSGKQLKNSE